MDREDLEERRRIAALLANQARHLEIDPEGILVVDDEEDSDNDPHPKQ
tara:strand:+ start:1814 stop:1957 length:144 start_codon:yes stop_codon:yes gene_type:complete